MTNPKIQLRHDTASNWSSVNPTLLEGEIGIETDTGKSKIGDGSTAWNSLSYDLGSTALQEVATQDPIINISDRDVTIEGTIDNEGYLSTLGEGDMGIIDFSEPIPIGNLSIHNLMYYNRDNSWDNYPCVQIWLDTPYTINGTNNDDKLNVILEGRSIFRIGGYNNGLITSQISSNTNTFGYYTFNLNIPINSYDTNNYVLNPSTRVVSGNYTYIQNGTTYSGNYSFSNQGGTILIPKTAKVTKIRVMNYKLWKENVNEFSITIGDSTYTFDNSHKGIQLQYNTNNLTVDSNGDLNTTLDLSTLAVSDNVANVTLSNVTSIADQSAVANALYNKVSKSGDTMTGPLSFTDFYNTSNDNDLRIITYTPNVIGTSPSSSVYTGIKTFDKDSNQIGGLNTVYESSGTINSIMYVQRTDSGSLVAGTLGVYIDQGGTFAYTRTPTPTDTTSKDSTQIASVGWANTTGNNIVHIDSNETITGLKSFTTNVGLQINGTDYNWRLRSTGNPGNGWAFLRNSDTNYVALNCDNTNITIGSENIIPRSVTATVTDDSTRIATTAFIKALLATRSTQGFMALTRVTRSGSAKFANGLHLEWGNISGTTGNDTAVTFRSAYNIPPIVMITRSAGATTADTLAHPYIRGGTTTTGVNVYFPASTGAYWFAIGNDNATV